MADYVPARDRFGAGDQTSEAEKALQQKKLDEIVGLLLGAGYFRVRIAGLIPFDKVVGGLCWCIAGSGASVEADIFYDEDLALGQKIRIAENVIGALRTMGCPHPLQANQIQGNDFNAIFPVVQWLVRQVIENREATGDYVRRASETHFDQSYRWSFERVRSVVVGAAATDAGSGAAPPSKAEIAELKSSAARRSVAVGSYLSELKDRYLPTRRFRRNESLWTGDAGLAPMARVQTCLLEYGEKLALGTRLQTGAEDAAAGGTGSGGRRGGGGGGASELDRRMAAMQRAAAEDDEARARAAADLEREMMGQMTAAAGRVSGEEVGRIMGLQSDELRRTAAAYSAREEALRQEAESGELLANSRLGRAQAHKRKVAKLAKRVELALLKRQTAEEELAGVLAELRVVQEALDATFALNDRARAEMAKLEARARELGKFEEWMMLRKLLATHESMLQQERHFKANCTRQRQELQERLAALRGAVDSSAETAQLARAEAEFSELEAKHRRLRGMLARRNREIQRVRRLIDDIPSRTELNQYQRRFVELYDQVAAKTEETRKYFALYNTLNEKRKFLAKEESLVGSIGDQFAAAMRSKKTTDAFLEQCRSILEAVQRNLDAQREQLALRRMARDGQLAAFQSLTEEQRTYFRAVKKFQEECDRNDDLAALWETVERRDPATAARIVAALGPAPSAAASASGGGGGAGGGGDA